MVQGKPVQVNVQKYQSMVLVAESEANNINLDINGVNIEQLKSIKFLVYSRTLNLIFVSTLVLFVKRLANR